MMERSKDFWTARQTNWTAKARYIGNGDKVYIVRRMSCGFTIWDAVINADSRAEAIEIAKEARTNAPSNA